MGKHDFESILLTMPCKRLKILLALAQGLTDENIALKFDITETGVRSHIAKIFKDFGIIGSRKEMRNKLFFLLDANIHELTTFVSKSEDREFMANFCLNLNKMSQNEKAKFKKILEDIFKLER